jgi:UDP-N-acetylmuramoylalanine--D-glutamate ligase
MAQGLGECRGLPHRLEFVTERDGVRYYNDSKSTTPESTCIAAEAFAGTPTILLVGGKPKGASFAEMGRLLARTCKHTICYGQAGPEIFDHFVNGSTPGTPVPAVLVSTFAQAVERARQLAAPGHVVVLSPACASYDEFTNYEERGEAFRRLVGG